MPVPRSRIRESEPALFVTALWAAGAALMSAVVLKLFLSISRTPELSRASCRSWESASSSSSSDICRRFRLGAG